MQIIKRKIQNMKQFEELRTTWENLENGREMTVFQTFRWHKLLVEEVLKTPVSSFMNSITIYELTDGEEVKLLFPVLVQKMSTKFKWFGRKRGVYFLGHNSWSDYNNAIYCDVSDEEIRYVMDKIKKDFHGYKILFTDMLPGTELDRAFAAQYSVCAHKKAVCVHRKADVEAYKLALSKHTKQNLRTGTNRMARDGIRYSIQKCRMLQDSKLADQLVDLHFQRFLKKNTGKNGMIHRIASVVKYYGRHYLEYQNNVVRESMMRMPDSCLVLVYINDHLAGYLYGLYDRSSVRIMQNCFSEDYSFYSPMFHCCYDLIVDSYKEQPEYLDKKIADIDFTRGDDAYKYKLGGTEILLNSYLL